MGRAKLQLKLIENLRQRRSTYRKRLQGLKKKTYELATLCDVPAVMISCDPSSGKIDTWPENIQGVKNVIEMYNGLSTEAQDGKDFDLLGFVHSGLRKQQLQLTSGGNTFDLHPCNGSPEALMEFLDSKLGMIRQRIQFLRSQTSSESNGDTKGVESSEEVSVISLDQCKQANVACNLSEDFLVDFDTFDADGCDIMDLLEDIELPGLMESNVGQQQDFPIPPFDVSDLPLSFDSSSEVFPWESSFGEYVTHQTSFGAHTTESWSGMFESSQFATVGVEEQFCTADFGVSASHHQMPAAENSSGMFDGKQFARTGVEEHFCASEFGFGGVQCQMPQAESLLSTFDECHSILTSGCKDQANYDRDMQAATDALTYGSSLWD